MPHPKPKMLNINKRKKPNQLRLYKRKTKDKLRKKVLILYNYTCAMCGESYPESNLHNDHIIPLTKGGEDTIDNCQCLCIKCHTIKSKLERN